MLKFNLKIEIHKTVILPVGLHAYETWSVILRDEHRLKVFENGVLGRILDLRGRKWQKAR
jgi:hypothetical protein